MATYLFGASGKPGFLTAWADNLLLRTSGGPDDFVLRALFGRDSSASLRTSSAGAPVSDGIVWLRPLGGPEALDTIVWLLPRSGSAALLPVALTAGTPVAAGFVQAAEGPPRSIVATDPLAGGLFGLVDMDNRTLLTGGVDSQGLGEGPDDVLLIGGGGRVALAGAGDIYERVVLIGGASYEIAAADGNVAPGRTIAIEATALGAGNSLIFDGSAEKDGHFSFQGGAGDDRFTGGAQGDTLYGLGGADWLAGGAGADRFGYVSASESTGAAYDTLADFNFGEDKIDLPVAVSGLAAAVTHGKLSVASFDSNLAAALTGHLGAGQAVFFTPDSGDLAGKAFLIVDGNGVAGYQPGEDFVFHMVSPPPADLTGTGFLV